MRPVGANRIPCKIEFVRGFTFAVTSEIGLELLSHHAAKQLVKALTDPRMIAVELIPRCELIMVMIEGVEFPLRFLHDFR